MRGHDERGDSLIEVLLAVMIIGVGVTGILGALGTGVTTSTVQRDRAAAEALLRDYAESVKVAPVATCGATDAYPGIVPAPSGLSLLPATVACPAGTLTQVVTIGVRAADDRVGDLTLEVVKRSVP